MSHRNVRTRCVGVAISAASMLSPHVSFAGQGPAKGPQVDYPLQFTVSPPVREMPPQASVGGPFEEKPVRRPPARIRSGNVADPVVQSATPAPAASQSLAQWEGLGQGYSGFAVTAVPPDTNMAVGPNRIVQWVNNAFVVFDKQGNQVLAPVADSTFWGSSTCNQLGGFSDPIIQYDRAANRWLVGEVALPLLAGFIGQFAQCFAVSTTADPTGPYYIWTYGFGTNINDYPKIGVWPDGYYVTWNIFAGGGATFAGPEACAFNRQAMLSGAAAPARVCFKLSNAYSSLLPSDLDGGTAPPAGAPNFLMDVDTASGELHLWKFHVDFASTGNSTFAGPTLLPGVAAFNAACPTTQDCIAQPATTQKLDALADRLMYRLAYRNFGDHESLVANHTVAAAGGNTAVRWYEVRSPNGAAVLHQQGTFAPDADNRWMASVAQDKSGNIAVGYAAASASTYPSIRYTGWENGDTPGTLQSEVSMISGAGSQTGYNRWGDYSAMRTDPGDDCTFWYTQEYQATTQAANWNTRIGSFRFPSCGATTAPGPTATALGSSPNPSTVGSNVTFTATVTGGSGTPTGAVTFKDNDVPLGSSALNGGGIAMLSTATLAAGSHAVTAVYGGDASFTGSTSPTLTQVVNKPGSSTVLTSSSNPSKRGQTVTFTATVSPSAATGMVTFRDGSSLLGTAALSGGIARISTSRLSVGTHAITAAYGGDATYSGSTSTVVNQTVTKK